MKNMYIYTTHQEFSEQHKKYTTGNFSCMYYTTAQDLHVTHIPALKSLLCHETTFDAHVFHTPALGTHVSHTPYVKIIEESILFFKKTPCVPHCFT